MTVSIFPVKASHCWVKRLSQEIWIVRIVSFNVRFLGSFIVAHSKEGLTRRYRVHRLKDHVDNVDPNVSLKALDQSWKLEGLYTEKHVHAHVTYEDLTREIEELDREIAKLEAELGEEKDEILDGEFEEVDQEEVDQTHSS